MRRPEFITLLDGAAATQQASQTRRVGEPKVDRLIESSSWTDATLALLELELPQWMLRRLVYE